MAGKLVTDPALLAQLNAPGNNSGATNGRLVTDPALLAQLDAPVTALDRVNAVGTGFNAGLAGIAGMPVDTAANVIDLGKAALGYGVSKITGEAPPKALEVDSDRSNVVGSTQWIRKYLDRNAITDTSMSRPDDKVSQYLAAAASALPGLAIGRPSTTGVGIAKDAAEAGALGTVPQMIADAGGNEGMQAAGGALASLARPAAAAAAEPRAPKPAAPKSDVAPMDMDGSQNQQAAVDKLQEHGIRVSAAQSGRGGKERMLGSLSRGADTAFGTSEFHENQLGDFTREVLKIADIDAKRATPDAMNKLRQLNIDEYARLHSEAPTVLDTRLTAQLEDLRKRAVETMGPDSNGAAVIAKQIDNLIGKAKLTPEAQAAADQAAKVRADADRATQMRSEDAADRMADRDYEAQRAAADQARAEAARVAELRMLNPGRSFDEPAPVAAPEERMSAVQKRAQERRDAEFQARQKASVEADAAQIPGAPPNPNRVIPGEAAEATRAALGKVSLGDNGVLKDFAGEMKNLLDDAFTRHATPDQAARMTKVRRRYARQRQIEDAAAGSVDGLISPLKLKQVLATKRNRSEYVYGKHDQDLAELTRAAAQVIPERLGNSGTASREMDVAKLFALVTNPVPTMMIGGGLLGARKLNEAPRGPATRKTPASPGPRPDPKIGATLTTETPAERKRRLLAEQLRK